MGCGASTKLPQNLRNEPNQFLLPVIDSKRSLPGDDSPNADKCKPTILNVYGAPLSDGATDTKRGIKSCKNERKEGDDKEEVVSVWRKLDGILTGRLNDMKNHVDNLLLKTNLLRGDIYSVLYQLQEEDENKGENSREMCCQCLDMFFTDNFIQEVIDRRRSSVMSTLVDSVSLEIDRILTHWLEETTKEIDDQVKNVSEFAEKLDQILVELKHKGLITHLEYIALRRESSEMTI